MNEKEKILQQITETARKVMPANAKVILFGSQARGDAREESDWDGSLMPKSTRCCTHSMNGRNGAYSRSTKT